jgi:CheY-like chemotaxis protein
MTEIRLGGVDGGFRCFIGHGVPWRLADGSVAGYIGTCTDITERKQAEAAQADADRRKDEFLAMLAHELRNPLAPIRMALHMIRVRQREGGALSERHLAILERQTENLGHIVDDLLDVSRVTRGKIELRKERVDLSSVVSRALDATRGLIESRRHDATTMLPAEPVHVLGDPVRLEQILVNLLANAAKYTDSGGSIAVSVRRTGAQAELCVRDTGVGIAPHMLDRIWHLFEQAERSLDRAQGGLGIGLSIVRNLVELHGGAVEARSPGLGQGSEFLVRLPIAPDDGVRPPREAPNALVEGPPRSQTRARPLRVLVVDDNVDAATTLGDLVRAQGHVVQVIHDGPAALAAAREHRPDIVFLDIGLPGMDGYEVARHLRAAGPCPAKLVAVTGYGQAADRQRAAEAGFTQHLVKPAAPTAVIELLGVEGECPAAC